jgi:hypothetical protein
MLIEKNQIIIFMLSNNFFSLPKPHTQIFDVFPLFLPETFVQEKIVGSLSFENLRDDFDEQQIDFVIKPITTIFKRLRNDDVWSGHEYGNCSDYCEECKNNKAQSIDDHCSIFPIFRHFSFIVLFSNLLGARQGRDEKFFVKRNLKCKKFWGG